MIELINQKDLPYTGRTQYILATELETVCISNTNNDLWASITRKMFYSCLTFHRKWKSLLAKDLPVQEFVHISSYEISSLPSRDWRPELCPLESAKWKRLAINKCSLLRVRRKADKKTGLPFTGTKNKFLTVPHAIITDLVYFHIHVTSFARNNNFSFISTFVMLPYKNQSNVD